MHLEIAQSGDSLKTFLEKLHYTRDITTPFGDLLAYLAMPSSWDFVNMDSGVKSSPHGLQLQTVDPTTYGVTARTASINGLAIVFRTHCDGMTPFYVLLDSSKRLSLDPFRKIEL